MILLNHSLNKKTRKLVDNPPTAFLLFRQWGRRIRENEKEFPENYRYCEV
jgi:hypothetical protein